MVIFYSENNAPFSGAFNPANANANARYLDHYNNYLILDAISRDPKDPSEKRQALKELIICEKKLAYWRRQPKFDLGEATRDAAKLKAAWRRD